VRLLRFLPLALVAIYALGGVPVASAAPGDLDPSFGTGGIVELLESNEESHANGIAVQPDGKILVAGNEKGNAVLLRLLPGGGLDPDFGAGGKVTTVLPTGFSRAAAVALQPDGKIVVAGGAKGAATNDFFFARFRSDGSPDISFGGGDGIELVPVGAEVDSAQALALGPGGRIVATGMAEVPVQNKMLAVVVLDEDGIPDPSFAGDGSVAKETAAKFDEGVTVAVLGDGGILVGDANGTGGGEGLVLMKLLSGGGFDPSFGGGDGVVVTPIPIEGAAFPAGRITDLALLPDGRIVASGNGLDYIETLGTYTEKIVAVRYTPAGELDPSFADGGVFTQKVADAGTVEAIELAEGGRLLLAGHYRNPILKQHAGLVARLRPGGSLDPAFGVGGLVLRQDTAPFGEGVENAAIDGGDRLVTIGTAFGPNNTSWVPVSRYLGDPRPLTPPVGMPPGDQPPNKPGHATMKAVPKEVAVGKLKGFTGVAVDAEGKGLRSVQIALVRRGRAKKGSPAPRCLALKNAKLRFKVLKAQGKQCPQLWVDAAGTDKWSFKFKGALPPGRYVVFARAVDEAGLAESEFSRKLGNRYGFRVSPPPKRP
jgi:uncharacterized delta-60 repeat protein